jgi:hypothetical protein
MQIKSEPVKEGKNKDPGSYAYIRWIFLIGACLFTGYAFCTFAYDIGSYAAGKHWPNLLIPKEDGETTAFLTFLSAADYLQGIFALMASVFGTGCSLICLNALLSTSENGMKVLAGITAVLALFSAFSPNMLTLFLTVLFNYKLWHTVCLQARTGKN